MNKYVIGAVIGAAVGYTVAKLMEKGTLDRVCDSVNDMAFKMKRDAKNVMDVSRNEAEYMADRAKNSFRRGKQKLENMIEE